MEISGISKNKNTNLTGVIKRTGTLVFFIPLPLKEVIEFVTFFMYEPTHKNV